MENIAGLNTASQKRCLIASETLKSNKINQSKQNEEAISEEFLKID